METQPHSLLRVYTDEAALTGDRRVFEVVLERAREARLLGATVHRAQAGFGHGMRLHKDGFLDHNYPIIIEIVDVEEPLREFAIAISSVKGLGLITLERVEAVFGGRTQPSTDKRLPASWSDGH